MPDRTTVLAGVLLIAFFVFITTRGQLLDYLGTIGLGPNADQWKHPSPAQDNGGGGLFSDLVGVATTTAKYAAMAGA